MELPVLDTNHSMFPNLILPTNIGPGDRMYQEAVIILVGRRLGRYVLVIQSLFSDHRNSNLVQRSCDRVCRMRVVRLIAYQ